MSTIYCEKCDKVVCIDCHLFSYYNNKDQEEHKEAIMQIINNLQNTHPKTDQPHLPGFYVYTDVLNTMKPNIIIDKECIAILPKKNYLLKIMRVYNTKENGEFVLKQIIPIKDKRIVEKEIQSAKNEFELMDETKAVSILSYHFGSNESAFEMLMENWGKPLDKINFHKLKEKELFQVIREYCGVLKKMNDRGIYHGDIKMENLILNKLNYIPKFIDYGSSSKLANTEEIFVIKTATINENNWEYLKGWTSYMAPTELLQYLNLKEDKSRIITYCLSKIDVFCLGLTLFYMIIQSDYQYMKKLQTLRSSSKTKEQEQFYEEIKRKLAEFLSSSPWNKEFTLKLVQIIKVCLQKVELRPNALELFPIIQLFDNLPLDQFSSLCQTVTTDQSVKIQELIYFNSLNMTIINIGIQFEIGLKLCAKAEIKLKDIFGENYYKNTREYLDICDHFGALYGQKGDDIWNCMGYREIALQIGEQLLTPMHPTLFRLYNEIAVALQELGLYEDSENMSKKVLNLRKQLYGDKPHTDVAASYNNLGSFYHSQCKYELAKENYTEALDQRLEIFGDKPHKHIAICYNNLGSVYDDLAEYEIAEVFYNDSLAINKQVYGEKAHPHIALNYNNLGVLYNNQSNYTKAEEMHIKALNQRLELYGNRLHPDIARSYNNLGYANQSQGKYKEGEKYHKKALNIYKHIHGERAHPDIALSYNNLGTIYGEQKDYKRAEEMHIKALNQRLELYGDTPHDKVAMSYNNLGVFYGMQGKFKRAEEYHVKALDIMKQIHGENDHPDIAKYYCTLGMVYDSQGDIIRAEEMYINALEQRLRIFGNNTLHEDIADSYSNLGVFYKRKGDHERALEYFTKAVDMISLIHPQNNSHPDVILYSKNLAIARGGRNSLFC